jgi:hypothetical protein
MICEGNSVENEFNYSKKLRINLFSLFKFKNKVTTNL